MSASDSLPPLDPARGYSIPVTGKLLGGVSPPTVYLLIRDQKIASYTIGKRRFVRGSEIARFTSGAPPEQAGEPISSAQSARSKISGRLGGAAKAARATTAT